MNKRLCSHCKKEMRKGYCIDDIEYYCSDKCLHKHYSEEMFHELYELGVVYWTEWEDELIYSIDILLFNVKIENQYIYKEIGNNRFFGCIKYEDLKHKHKTIEEHIRDMYDEYDCIHIINYR